MEKKTLQRRLTSKTRKETLNKTKFVSISLSKMYYYYREVIEKDCLILYAIQVGIRAVFIKYFSLLKMHLPHSLLFSFI